tara:strand:+ start:609 stop:944 length:336 start_codon:yes stop_codon:yes gene_type:complete
MAPEEEPDPDDIPSIAITDDIGIRDNTEIQRAIQDEEIRQVIQNLERIQSRTIDELDGMAYYLDEIEEISASAGLSERQEAEYAQVRREFVALQRELAEIEAQLEDYRSQL